MKKLKLLILPLVFLFIFIFQTQSFGLTALEIIKKSQDIVRGQSSKGTMEMTIIKPKWKRTMVMDFWEDGRDKFFTRITSPAKDAGVSSLKIEKNMWNYLPNIERTIKIPPSLMSQPWLGSDFTNDDLVRENSLELDFTHNLLGEEVINGTKSYKVELIPKQDAAVVWGKIIYYVDVKDFLPVKEEFYDEDGKLIRLMIFSDVKKMHDRLIPAKMEMIPINKEGNKTILIYKDIQFNVKISDEIFSLRNLKEGK